MMSRMIAVAVLMKLAAAQADIIVPTSSNAYFTIVRTTTGGQTTFAEASSYNEERLLMLKSLACPSPANPAQNKCQGRVHFFPPHFDRLDLPEPVDRIPYGYAKVTEENPSVATIDLSLWGNRAIFVADLLTEWRTSTSEPLRFVPTTRGSVLANAKSIVTDNSGRKGLEVEFNIFNSNVCFGCTNAAGDCTGCPEGVTTMRFYLLMSAVLLPPPPPAGQLTVLDNTATAGAGLKMVARGYGVGASQPVTGGYVTSWQVQGFNALHFRTTGQKVDLTHYTRFHMELQCSKGVTLEINVGKTEDGDQGMWNIFKGGCTASATNTIDVALPGRASWAQSVGTPIWVLVAPYNNGGSVARNQLIFLPNAYFY